MKRDKIITFRISSEELELLRKLGGRIGESQACAIRTAIRDKAQTMGVVNLGQPSGRLAKELTTK